MTFLQNVLVAYVVVLLLSSLFVTIRPVAHKGYGLIAHEAKPIEWAIDLWPLRAKGLIVLVSPN